MVLLKRNWGIVIFFVAFLATALAAPMAKRAFDGTETTLKDEREAKDRYELTKERMPLVYQIAERFKRSQKLKILIGLPLTFETLSVIDALRSSFEIIVIPQSSGPSSSLQTGVFEYLDKWEVQYFTEATEESRIKALSTKPDIIVDCSYMLGEVAMKFGLMSDKTVFIEDTKTGENRLEALREKYGVPARYVVLDNSFYKRKYENSTGIGYSVVGALMSMGFFFPRYTVGVVGYGHVGSGLAKYLRDMGARNVFITEINLERVEIARKEGFSALSVEDLLKKVDMVITATGMTDVIKRKDLEHLDKRLIIANAGGEDEWIREVMFHGAKPQRIHEDMVKYQIGLCDLWEVGDGNSINLVREISVTEFLDITFSQLVFILYHLDLVAAQGKTDVKKLETISFKELVHDFYGPPTGVQLGEIGK